MKKEIALVDCNNFFVSCEQLLKPDLKGKPVCVLSNNDGCIIARSNEAKKLGITMAMPHFIAKRQFPDAVYLSSNMGFYHDISIRVRQKLFEYSPIVEVYSIDEAFLDLTGVDKVFGLDYEQLVSKIKIDIINEIGIPVSVGLATSKVLAKLATEKAKKGDGVLRITEENRFSMLKNLQLEDIWGVGRGTANILKRFGIFSALEILNYDDDFYKRILGKRGLELKNELMGNSVLKLEDTVQLPKSIQRTSSFPKFSNDKMYIKETLFHHLHSVCSKLRHYNLGAKSVVVMLRTKDFRLQMLSVDLEVAINDEYLLNKKVDELLDKLFETAVIYRSSGVFAENLSGLQCTQLKLNSELELEKAQRISKVWDKIEGKYGKKVFSIGKLPKK